MFRRRTLATCRAAIQPVRRRPIACPRYSTASAAAESEETERPTTVEALPSSTDLSQTIDVTKTAAKINVNECCELIVEIGSRRAGVGVNADDFALAKDTVAFGLLEEIQKAGGHPTNSALYFALRLACAANHDYHVHAILQLYDKYWKTLAPERIIFVTKHYCDTDATEQCMAFFEKIRSVGRHIPGEAYSLLLAQLDKVGAGDIAFQVLQDIYASDNVKSIVNAELCYNALALFADCHHVKGLQWSWNKAIGKNGPLTAIDGGLCTKILQVCGRHGLPILATNVLYFMDSTGIAPRSYHYASLIDSYCVAGDVKNAFNILTIMREAGHTPDMSSCAGILRYMAGNQDIIDRAFFTVQDLKTEGNTIDIAALNVLLDACVVIEDISRAMATFGEYKTWDVKPEVSTLNSLLLSAALAYRKDVALSMLKLFDEQFGVLPDATTYTQLITVCIAQDDYEDAFKYLEDMKAQGHQPPLEVYQLLVDRCLLDHDPRAKVAYEEMQGWGYNDYHTRHHMKAGADLTIVEVTPKKNRLYEAVMATTFPERQYVSRPRQT